MKKKKKDDTAPTKLYVKELAPCSCCLNISVLPTLMPTQKHGYATAQNVEFCTLLLDQVTALLAKRLARITNFLLLLLLLTVLACVAFLHCHDMNDFSAKFVYCS